MRFIAVGALSISCALVGCAHNQSSPPAPASPPAEQQKPSHGSDAASTGDATTAPAAQTPSPARPEGSGSRTTPDSRSTSPKDSSSQGMTSTKPKPATGPRNTGGSEAGAGPAAGAPKPQAPRPATSSPPPAPASAPKANPPPPAAPALDLTSLEQRLKDTRAIGVFTKLSVKNQVDDLLSQFRAFHNRKTAIPLSDLRQRYDLLLLKVLSLLQDGDPPLASAISGSREAIWGILSDPQKFAKL